MKTNKLWSILMMFVLVLGMTATFSSCGSDDEEIIDDENNNSTIIGTWYCEDNPEVGGICFNADGTGYSFFDGKSKKDYFTYEAKNGKIIYLDEDEYEGMSPEYVVSGNKLVLRMNGMSITFTRRA